MFLISYLGDEYQCFSNDKTQDYQESSNITIGC